LTNMSECIYTYSYLVKTERNYIEMQIINLTFYDELVEVRD